MNLLNPVQKSLKPVGRFRRKSAFSHEAIEDLKNLVLDLDVLEELEKEKTHLAKALTKASDQASI